MLAFVLVVPIADVELAADRLFQLGVTAVEERSSDVAGHAELWTEVGDSDEAIAAAAGSLPPAWAWHTCVVDESVAGTWRQFATPIWVTDQLVVVPAWWAGSIDLGSAMAITIDPGAAFGMGDHPTTRLTLRAMIDELDRASEPSVLDVGCGSGILAIVAARRGARRVVAIDIATAAIEATVVNAAANGVSAMVDASTTGIAELDGGFDVVVANVLAPPLIAMATELRRVLAPGGALVVSGIRTDRQRRVLDALRPLVPVATTSDDGWAAVTLTHSGRIPIPTTDGARS
jgi:ribosomal protein L11 methyltransferase